MDDDLRTQIAELQRQLDEAVSDRSANAAAAYAANRKLRFLEAMLDIVPVGVVLADADGKITLGNSNVEKMLGHPVLHSEDVEAYDEWHAFHPDGRALESHEYPLARILGNGEDEAEVDVQYERGDGSRFWMRILGQPVNDEDGKCIGAAVALIDIDEQKRLLEQQQILIGELNHRVKNAFTVVKSIVSQSLRKVSVSQGLRKTIDRRLDAYASAHAKLIGSSWEHAPVGGIANDVVAPIADGRVKMEGPLVELPTRQALALSMTFYELSTNALKYGALSVSNGTVSLNWSVSDDEDGPRLKIDWIESGGPISVEPKETGFGSFIIDRALAMETSGRVDLNYSDKGFEWHLNMPLEINTMETK